jgi:hypothetical protein
MICSDCVHSLVRTDFEGNVRTSCCQDGVVIVYRVVKCSRFKGKEEEVPGFSGPEVPVWQDEVPEQIPQVEKSKPGRKLGWRKVGK